VTDLWEELAQAATRFGETPLARIRADAFFNLCKPQPLGWLNRTKRLLYPFVLASRCFVGPKEIIEKESQFIVACDYGAEPGLGTLLPVFNKLPSSLLVANTNALSAAARNLQPGAYVCIDACAARHFADLPNLWRRSKSDLDHLLDSVSPSTRTQMVQARRAIRALLVRAYLYERAVEEIFEQSRPRAVLLHNDFTSLSLTHIYVARRYGIADYTLQHGFPTREYFPTTSSSYLLWGQYFYRYMRQQSVPAEVLQVVGAPRLDKFSRFDRKVRWVERSPRVLFLSQTHAQLFSVEEHRSVLQIVETALQDSDISIRVKLHPQENTRAFRPFPNLAQSILPANTRLEDAIGDADVVISINSTGLCEAMLMGRLAIQIYAHGMESRIGSMRIDPHLSSAVELLETFRYLRRPGNYDDAVQEQQKLVGDLVHEPGRGTANVLDFIGVSQPRGQRACM
jgi:hypothetical protein